MRYLLPILLLAGCSQAPRQLNPGAIVPIYAVSREELAARFPQFTDARGVCWRDEKGASLWLSPRWIDAGSVAIALHEFCHLASPRCPKIFDMAAMVDAPGFRTTKHSATR